MKDLSLSKYTQKEIELINSIINFKEKYFRQKEIMQKITNELKTIGIFADKPIYEANLEIRLANKELTSYFYPISKKETLIGRSKNCSIILPLPRVSLKHAKIFINDNKHFIRDLGSLNGTRLNGEILNPFEPYELKAADEITISDFKLIFHKFIKEPPNNPIKLEFFNFNSFNNIIKKNFKWDNYIFFQFRLKEGITPLFLMIPKKGIYFLSLDNLNIYYQKKLLLKYSENPQLSLIEQLISEICLILNKEGIAIEFDKTIMFNEELLLYFEKYDYGYYEIWSIINGNSLSFILLIPELNIREAFDMDFSNIPSFLKKAEVNFNIEIGYTFIPLSSLFNLEEEDIILLDYCLFSDLIKEGEYPDIKLSSASSIILEGLLQKKKEGFLFKISNITKRGNNIMDNSIALNGKAIENEIETKRKLLKDMEVLINVGLGKIKITIDDLMNLKKEQIITLDKKITDEVNLFFNNQLIGKGVLVDIDGKIGVRLTAWLIEKENEY